MTTATALTDPPQIVTRPDGSSIAYHRHAGKGTGVVFLHGLMSDMEGGKALHVEAHCRARGLPFVRFDQFGHGQSSGTFAEGTIGRWAEDTLAVLDTLCEGPQILVGSSMGGWLMLLAARARPEKVAGLVGIAAAPDFTEDLLWPQMSPEQRAEVMDTGFIEVPSDYAAPYIYTRALIEDGRANLVLRQPLPFAGPVRLLHGLKDDVVPWQTALAITEAVDSPDIEAVLIKSGDHRLSDPADLARLSATLDSLLP